MPYTDRLRAMDTTGGENSRQTRFEIENNQVRELVNLMPGKVAIPRGGCPKIGDLTRSLDWIFPFQDNAGSKLSIGKSGTDLVQVSISGDVLTIVASAFPTNESRPCAVRVGDTVLVSCDQQATVQAWAVTKKSNFLYARPANLDRPASTVLSATMLNSTDAWAIASRTSRKFATTWVTRTDIYGTPSGTPVTTKVWGDAIAESWEDADERLIFTGGDDSAKSATTLTVVVSQIPAGATHLRLWASQATAWESDAAPGKSASIAAGSYARFWIDISISAKVAVAGGFSFTATLDVTEGQLAGQTHVVDTTGADETPSCSWLRYHNGLLWAGGGDASSDPGRCFYSLDVSDPPVRTLSLFSLADRYVPTSVNGTERTMGAAASHGHLIFFNEHDIYRLTNGDPTHEAIRIAEGMGTTFPNSICEKGQQIWYLSEQGPAVVSDNVVSLIEEFNVSSVWPVCDLGSTAPVGYFYSLDRLARQKVRSWWKENVWYISDGEKTAAMKMEQNTIQGGFQFELAETSGFKPLLISQFSDREVFAFSETLVCSWASNGVYTDGASGRFMARVTTRPIRMDGRRREKLGEVYDIIAHCKWVDNGQLSIICTSQGGRRNEMFQYDQRPITEPLQNTDIDNRWRGIVQQGVREGLVGNWFEIGIRKIIYGPFEFDGMEIGVLLREGHEMEYVSMDSDPEIPPVLDAGILIYDQELNRGFNG